MQPMQDINDPEHGNQFSAGGGDSFARPEDLPTAAPQADPFSGYEDYYAFDERDRWYFPDRKQWIEFKKLTEGDRAKYLKATRSDVRVNQKSGDAYLPFDQSEERKNLLLHSITDWHIVQFIQTPEGRRAQPIAFQPVSHGGKGGVVAQWIDRANPAVLAELEKAIRKANPWLLNEMSVEQIDKEIADLQELRVAAAKRDADEGNSDSK